MAQIYSILGNSQKLDGGSMFGNCPRVVWEKWLSPDEQGRVELSCRALLIQINGKNVLLEAGIGAFMEPKLASRYGVKDSDKHVLLESLISHGFKPENIDIVILSHLHFDHCGGILPTYEKIQKSGLSLVFPKAQFVVGKNSLERAKKPHPRDKASFIPGVVELLESSGRLHVIDGVGSDLLGDSFEFYYSDGHTPGHLHTLFRTDQGAVFFCGDLIPGLAWVNLPITMGYDRFPEMLIDEKKKILELADQEDWLLFYTHDPDACASKVVMQDNGRCIPAGVVRSLENFCM